MVLATFLWAAAPTPEVSESDFRRAAAIFLAEPASAEGRAAVQTVIAFSAATDKVEVTISPGLTPWTFKVKKYKNDELLLGAYIAGNTLGQLDSGVKGNDPYSGIIQVFRVYRYLKAQDRTLSVPDIDALLAIHKKGELAVHLAKIGKEKK
jgi:hypothetical protein